MRLTGTVVLGSIATAFYLGGCGGTITLHLGTDPDTYELIDDMEDGNDLIEHTGGRSGYWSVFNDGSEGMQWPRRDDRFVMSPLSPPRGASHFAARTYGSGFTNPTGANHVGWAQMDVGFIGLADVMDGGLPLYDASHFQGVRFWARLGDPDAQSVVHLNFEDLQTDPRGGQCDADTTCYNRFTANVYLTTEWTHQRVLFKDLEQARSWGKLFPDIDIEHVFALSFVFTGSEKFDLWIDDLEFIQGDYPRRTLDGSAP
jgi:hypothetical protein